MIVLGILGGIAALAVGLIIAELRGKGRRPRPHIDARAVDIGESNASYYVGGHRGIGEYFPPPDDGRPQK